MHNCVFIFIQMHLNNARYTVYSMNIILDCETTGLPEYTSTRRIPSYKQLSKYDKCRIVSISWIVTQKDEVVQQAYYLIKPDGFVVTSESQAIHGISHQEACDKGVPLAVMVSELKTCLEDCVNIVAHNIEFDIHVIKSELYRYNYMDLLDLIENKHLICTMKKGKEVMKTRKYPKLGELYKYLYNEEIQNAHNAQYDTLYCYRCYNKMYPSEDNVFFFGNKKVQLTAEQCRVVYEDANKNILTIACAGSGKTTTTLCRIKHLIKCGVDEQSIMLTTFTRDAANDMKNKLFDILGYKANICCGTIDSIAKMYCERFGEEVHLKHVGEYGFMFLDMIRKNPSLIAKYKYLFVDEFQDINDVQFNIIKCFYDNGCFIFAVGDDAQNIYSFRGSKIDYILNYCSLFGNSIMYKLTHNFRSSPQIINIANAIIEKNVNQIPKQMIPGVHNDGPKPHLEYFDNYPAQNNTILALIQQFVYEEDIPEDEIAVLSPVNQSLYHIEELLTKHNIKNVYLDGKSDVRTTKKPGHVCLSTIHKSKGLEWDKVIVINANDDIIPKMKNEKNIEEDRRLFYVGATRAKKELRIYYTKGFNDSRFVTRFLSELDRGLFTYENMQEYYFQGRSDTNVCDLDMSVTKLIENLGGEDFITLKSLGIIPKLDPSSIRKEKIYESFSYKPFIEKDDLYSDFGIFVEKFITREVARFVNKPMLCKDRHVCQCLANVKLEPKLYEIYNQYKHNFKTNMIDCEPFLENMMYSSSAIKELLQRNSKFVNPAHMQHILQILGQIYANAKKYGLAPHEIPVFNFRFLPDGFEEKMYCYFMQFKDLSHSYQDVLEHIWNISKCKKIVTDYRRRLLYKNVPWQDFCDYDPMFINIHTNLMNFLDKKGLTSKEVECEKKLRIEEGMYGESDLRIGDLIIDYKTSINDDIDMKWLVQLLCYKVLNDFNKRTISKIAILNPLRGWYSEVDVSEWNKHHELVSFLLNKREEKLANMK